MPAESGAAPRPRLAILDALAPPPPSDLVATRIERHTSPGDTVLDLHAGGGWIAREAIDRGRRAISLESGPLTRTLAELVLRPPARAHLDAALAALAAVPVGELGLEAAIDELFLTRCRRCDAAAVAEAFEWGRPSDGDPAVPWTPIATRVACPACAGDGESPVVERGPVDEQDIERSRPRPGFEEIRAAAAARFPVPDDGRALVDDLLGLHTHRQLAGLVWIAEAIEGTVRAEPIEAALRLALLGSIGPASGLAGPDGEVARLEISEGRVRLPEGPVRLERHPWRAFAAAFAALRDRLPQPPEQDEMSTETAGHARFVPGLRELAEDPAGVLVATVGPTVLDDLARQAGELVEQDRPRPVRFAIGQPPATLTQQGLALAFHATGWTLGAEAVRTLPVEPLLGPPFVPPAGWSVVAVRRALEGIEPLLDLQGRAVLLVNGAGVAPLAAAALGAAGAGYRLAGAHLVDADEDRGAVLELTPPSASAPPGPRTRANVSLPPVPGGPGDPEIVPGPGLFSPPERVDARPFSPADAARVVTDTAVTVLAHRGEPARLEQLATEILVALDQAGHLRRLVAGGPAGPALDGSTGDVVERLTSLIEEELRRPTQRRLVEVEPGRWWLGDRDERGGAAASLADRVEWAVYSLLSTAGPLPERAFGQRIGSLFGAHDQPDAELLRACLESYRSRTDGADGLTTDEDLVARSHEHTELLAALAEGGHRLGLDVWLGAREQTRRVGDRRLWEWLTERERDLRLPLIARAPVDDIAAVDCIWYAGSRAAFLFEVEWTAMLGDVLLRRHARIPQDDRLVRFLAIPAERTELVRYKLARSPLLRAAVRDGNWHIVKWPHLRAFLAADPIDLNALEPLLGLDPEVERANQQLPLFGRNG